MDKFHQIATDKFIPISHDNSYLFNHYDKVANFLAFNLDKNYKSILGKPVQNGYEIDWFSNHTKLEDIKNIDKELSEVAFSQYWNFMGVINSKINQLQNSNDENNKNWAGLLSKVFNHQDNFLFFNGDNLSIVWGWKFQNTDNYKPKFLVDTNKREDDLSEPLESPEINVPENEVENNQHNEQEESLLEDEEIIEEEFIEDEVPFEENFAENHNFLEFLKWFASKYWYSLVILTVMIMLVFLFKSINYVNYNRGIEKKLNEIENNAAKN